MKVLEVDSDDKATALILLQPVHETGFEAEDLPSVRHETHHIFLWDLRAQVNTGGERVLLRANTFGAVQWKPICPRIPILSFLVPSRMSLVLRRMSLVTSGMSPRSVLFCSPGQGISGPG